MDMNTQTLYARRYTRQQPLTPEYICTLVEPDELVFLLMEPENRLFQQDEHYQSGRIPNFPCWGTTCPPETFSALPLRESWVFAKAHWHHLVGKNGQTLHVHWTEKTPEDNTWTDFTVTTQEQTLYSWQDKGRFRWLEQTPGYKATVREYFHQGKLLCWRIVKVTND